jgi:hypothetical protein
VIGDIASPVDLVETGPFLRKLCFRDQQVAEIAALAKGVDMGVFHKKKKIRSRIQSPLSSIPDLDIQYFLKPFFLVIPDFLIITEPQIFKGHLFVHIAKVGKNLNEYRKSTGASSGYSV